MIKKGKEITDIEVVKKIEVNVLDTIVDFCDQHNLRYILAYGTLLGAVRHKGFIPWDDDIDILMPRKDYQKLVELWKDTEDYGLFEITRNDDYIYAFAKMYDKHTFMLERGIEVRCDMGIYVDIFPYDAVDHTYEQSKKFIKKCETLEKCRVYSLMPYSSILHEDARKNFGRKILWKILRKLGPSYFSKKLNALYPKYVDQFDTCENLGCLCTRDVSKELLPREVFDDVTELEFEGRMYKVPAKYDLMLTIKYGDYMQLPPMEERVFKHGFKAWECERD